MANWRQQEECDGARKEAAASVSGVVAALSPDVQAKKKGEAGGRAAKERSRRTQALEGNRPSKRIKSNNTIVNE
jgi:hypothetical protein